MRLGESDRDKIYDVVENKLIGIGSQSELEAWATRGDALVREQWSKGGWQARVQGLIGRAESVRGMLREMERTYTLPGGCDHVGSA